MKRSDATLRWINCSAAASMEVRNGEGALVLKPSASYEMRSPRCAVEILAPVVRRANDYGREVRERCTIAGGSVPWSATIVLIRKAVNRRLGMRPSTFA